MRNRLLMACPLFIASLLLNFASFSLIWRYFGWANQALAAVTLWAAAVYLRHSGRKPWIAVVPACFMTAMTSAYIFVESRENGCLGLGRPLGTMLGIAVSILALGAFLRSSRRAGASRQLE